MKNTIRISGSVLLVVVGVALLYTATRSSGVNTSEKNTLAIGYLPVTCHLTCPVTQYASETTASQTHFQSKRFGDFPTVVSALEAKQVQATFMIAPLAMKLKEQGVPIKICYLGHREGSQIVIKKDNPAKDLRALKGKILALPSRYSNQNLVINKLMTEQGMRADDIKFVEIPPGEMPTALASGAIDAYFVGEPHCAKAEMDGTGRVLYYARDIWPDFISCVLVVHEDLINNAPHIVSDLVRGIAQSGHWAQHNRKEAARLVAPYYRQNPALLDYVLTSNPERVKYVDLTPTNEELMKIGDMALAMGLLSKPVVISELVDRRFIPEEIEAISLSVPQ